MNLNVKLLSALLLLFFVVQGDEVYETTKADITDTLLKLLACVVNLLKEGAPKHNVPSLDPLSIGKLRIDLDSEMFKGYLAMENFFLKGILDIKVNKLKADLSLVGGINIVVYHSINLEEITLETDYDTDLRIFQFLDLYGKGHLSVKLSNLGISGRVVIGIAGESIEINEFTLKLSLGASTIKFTGLLNDECISEIISKALSDLLPHLIEKHSEELSKIILELIGSLAGEIDFEKMMEIVKPCMQSFKKTIK